MTEPQEATLSFISPPSASPQFLLSTPGCHSCSSSPSAPFSFLGKCKQHTSPPPAPLSSAPTHTHTPTLQSRTLIPRGADSDISASALLSSVSPVISAPFPLPFMFWLHADSDASPFFPSALSAPTLFHPFLFFSSPFAFLYLALSRLPFTMTDLSSLLYANRSPVS